MGGAPTADVTLSLVAGVGVEQRTHFLRDVANSSAIRKHLIENWNKANLPSVSCSTASCQWRLSWLASSLAVSPLVFMRPWPKNYGKHYNLVRLAEAVLLAQLSLRQTGSACCMW